MRIIINLHNRCQAAGTDAGYSFQSKTQVIGRMPGLNAQLLFQSLQNCFAATHMAGSYLAHADNVASRGLRWNNE